MNGVEFRLLAPRPSVGAAVAAVSDGGDVRGPEPARATPRELCVLAILLLSAGRPVTAPTIIEHLWEDDPPPAARRSLSSYISRLRRRLRDTTDGRADIITRDGSYILRVDDPESIDLHRIDLLHRQASAVADSGDCDHAVALLRQAEQLWAGEALTGLPGSWARRMADTLADKLRAIRCQRIEWELQLGRHRRILNELHHLLTQYPADETIAGYVMTALYRDDRRTDALAVYAKTRRYIVENLGNEPGDALRDLHQRILQADHDLAVTPAYRRQGAAQPNTLPPDMPYFTGRTREIETVGIVRADRAGPGVVVIQGMPGIGKTALAVHAAHRMTHRYPDACVLVNMRAHDPIRPPLDSATALGELLRMMGIAPGRIPHSLAERSAMWHAELAHRRAIVILDDAAGPEQVRPLVPGNWAGLMMITTRVRHGWSSHVRALPLDVLPDTDATQLCARLLPDDAPPSTINRIIQICGGLPLAIQLLAGRATTGLTTTGLTTTGLETATGLENSPPSWPGEPPGAEPDLVSHDQQIRTAFDLSYRDLPPPAQLAFRRLGLSPCHDTTPEAASALIGCSLADAEAAIEVLLRHHLLAHSAHGRYRFHSLIAAYARDRAHRDDLDRDRRAAIKRLLDHYLRMTDAADRVAHPHRWKTPAPTNVAIMNGVRLSVPAARRWLDTEWNNVLQVAEYAAGHEWAGYCADLMHTIAEYLDNQRHLEQAAGGHRIALNACRQANDMLGTARASLDLGLVAFRAASNKNALIHTQQALRLYRDAGQRHAEAKALDQLGLIHWAAARNRQALAHYADAEAIYATLDDARGQADVLAHSAISHFYLCRYEDCLMYLSRALKTYQNLGDLGAEAKILSNIGNVHSFRGYHREARQLNRKAARLYQKISGRQDHRILSHNLGNIHQYKERYELALACYRAALAAYKDSGEQGAEANVLNCVAATYLRMDQHAEALIHFTKALNLAEAISDSYERLRASVGAADVHRAAGHYEQSRDIYRQALPIARLIDDLYHEARIHDGLGHTSLHLFGPDAARISWRQAHELYGQLGLHREKTSVTIQLHTLGGLTWELSDPDL